MPELTGWMIDWYEERLYLICPCSGPSEQVVVMPVPDGQGQCDHCGRRYRVHLAVTQEMDTSDA